MYPLLVLIDEPASCHVLNIIKQLSIEFEVDTFDGMMAKLAVLESDLSKPDLGLSENDYSIVKTEVDLVIHNGAHVNHILKYNGSSLLKEACNSL